MRAEKETRNATSALALRLYVLPPQIKSMYASNIGFSPFIVLYIFFFLFSLVSVSFLLLPSAFSRA